MLLFDIPCKSRQEENFKSKFLSESSRQINVIDYCLAPPMQAFVTAPNLKMNSRMSSKSLLRCLASAWVKFLNIYSSKSVAFILFLVSSGTTGEIETKELVGQIISFINKLLWVNFLMMCSFKPFFFSP